MPTERTFPNPGRHARYVCERRDADGKLDLRGPQPPAEWIHGVYLDDVFMYYWRHSGNDAKSASQETIIAWFESKGWTFREKTW